MERRPVTVRLDGRTDLHNYYPESWQRRDQQKHSPKRSSTYSLRRTRATGNRVAEVHGLMARTLAQKVYLVTHTTSPEFIGRRRYVGTPAAPIDQRRRASLALLLDAIRKLPGYRGHYWVAELHEGERNNGGGANLGTLHHHIAVRLSSYWDYRRSVQVWSMRYCGSRNGLDVSPPKGNGSWKYLFGCWKYLDLEHAHELPFRWWGTSAIPRKWTVHPDEVRLDTRALRSTNWKVRCARIYKEDALSDAARIANLKETRRQVKRNEGRQRKLTKPTVTLPNTKQRPAGQGKIKQHD